MFTKKSTFRIFSCLLILTFLLISILPAQVESLARPLYASGDFLWAKGMGGTNYEIGMDVAIDSSGNVYTAGYFRGTTDFDPGTDIFNLTGAGDNSNSFDCKYDIFVSKLDSSGNFVWAKRMGGTDDDTGVSIAVDSTGNVYITGYFIGTVDFDPGSDIFNLTSAGGRDIFVSKLDNNGNFVWAKRMGGDYYEEGNSITLDSNDNVYTTGTFGGTADFDPGSDTFNLTSAGEAIFVSKLDSNGNFLWAKSMGAANAVSRGYGITIDSNSNVYTTGQFQYTVDFDPGSDTFNLTSAGNDDIFVSKLDSNGNFVWAKRMGGITSSEKGNSIAVDSNGNVYTTGFFFNGTADFDPGTGTANLTTVGGFDIFISKLDSNGNFAWAKSMGGRGRDEGYNITIDSSGSVYTTGYFSFETVDFDPGVGIVNLTNAGSKDIFVSKLDSNGNFLWAKSMGGTGGDIGRGIALASSGDYVYTTGVYETISDFDPGVGIANLTAAGTGDVFVSKLSNEVLPFVSSIVRANANPNAATSVDFTVTFSKSMMNIDLDDFSLTTSGVSGAAVSGISGSGSVYTITVNTGSGDGTIRLDISNTPSIQDLEGNTLIGPYNNGETYIIDKTSPTISSIARNSSNPTVKDNVDFTVIFDEDVTGVDTVGPQFDDFYLTASPDINAASIASVSGSSASYIVTVNTGTGNGTLRLDVPDTATITDPAGNSLADLPFTSGRAYTIFKSVTYLSVAANDGWALEASETSNRGGTKNTNGLLRVGDDAKNNQFRSLLYFDISNPPNNAVLSKVTLKIKLAGNTTPNPFTTHGDLLADMAKGFFGLNALENADFQAKGIPRPNVGRLTPVDGEPDWYQLVLSPANFKYINLGGVTQFRLRFTKDDDNDKKADFISFFSGDDATNPPQLIVEFTTP